MDRAKSLGIEFHEIPIALDGLAVVVNSKNDFCKHLTVEELKRLWSPGGTINNWKDIRPGFPDMPIKLYGPGTDSGTFDYFTQVICGKEKASRSDFTASENDNVLVQGVQGDVGALGYFGLSYYEANKGKLKAVAIDPGDGKPIFPSVETVRNGQYHPLSRPLFIYVNNESSKRPEVRAFLEYLFANAPKIVEHPKVNYVALPGELYSLVRQRVHEGKVGSMISSTQRGGSIDLLKLYRGQ
jgi:phosphate transport system substrate-binding protein